MRRISGRPIVAAIICAAAVVFSSSSALAQYYPNGGWYGSSGDRPVDGTVTYFNQFDLQIATNGARNGTRDDRNRGNHYGRGRDRDDERDGDDNRSNGYGYNGYNGYNRNNGNNRYGYNANTMAIHLHQGTIINPRGTTLQNGMAVHIIGHPNGDGTFEADEIDVRTPNNYGYGY